VACRVADVSRSCYYEHKFHVPSDREIRRLLVSGLVADIHKRSRGTYGMLRIRAALMREQGMVVNKKMILSIMRELGIKGLPGPKKHKKNLVNQATEEDLVKRNFTVDRPNVLWLTDITEHPTREGKVYCCVVLDAYSRRAVGWAIDRRCETALVNDAVLMASESRKTGPDSIIHSDHGSQYTSWGFSELIRTKGLLGSMGTIGDCFDNAPMESFWGSMQIELLNRKKWRTKIELSIAMAEWIEHFYNPERLHSSLGYVPPVEFEALHTASIQAGLL
jgi:transposase InsO family protein